jgi:hypothetical protein
MSFSVKCERSGLEYKGSSLGTLFAQASELAEPAVLPDARRHPSLQSKVTAALERRGPGTLVGELSRRAALLAGLRRALFASHAHSDQALSLLSDPSEAEREILRALPYQENRALLHTDSSLLPRSRRAWASWNYHLLPEQRGRAVVTYYLNSLQNLSARETFCLTLNRTEAIDPSRVLERFTYHHYFGYCFNPVSFYYCYAPGSARLEALVAEVSNTPWGERHCYVLDERLAAREGSSLRYRFRKQFHVSPFMDMDFGYDWRFYRARAGAHGSHG